MSRHSLKTKRYNITIRNCHAEMLRLLGGGNMSLGIRRAAEARSRVQYERIIKLIEELIDRHDMDEDVTPIISQFVELLHIKKPPSKAL